MSFCRTASISLAVVLSVPLVGCKRLRHEDEAKQQATRAIVARSKQQPKLPPLGPPIDTANAIAYRIFQRTASTGMVAVIVRGDETWMAGYGQTQPGSRETPHGDSLLRLCSISKILATDLLSKLIADRKAELDDPLQKFAPEGVIVRTKSAPGEQGRPIELIDLATHTAGMPREIAYPPAGFAHFTFPDFNYRWQWLPQFYPRYVPGTAAHYSNIGFDLLGDAVAKASGESYLSYFNQQTAKPLGLQDTTLAPNPAQCARLMTSAREPSECTDTEAAAGSGGMYSSARDMAKLLRYFLNLPGVPIHANPEATAVVLDPAKLRSMEGLGHAGLPDGIGLGWIEINKAYGESRIVEKTGGGAGFQTYIALDPARHAGIFIGRTQSRSRGGANMFREANDLLLTMVGLPPVPANPGDPERELTADELREANADRRAARKGTSVQSALVHHGHRAAALPAPNQNVRLRRGAAPSAAGHAPARRARRR